MTTGGSATRLVVLGAGPGGYPAAFLAADLGMAVTLVDVEANPGGVCLYRGCIPSKTLLHVAHVLDMAEQVTEFGVDFAEPTVDLDRLRQGKDRVVVKMTRGLRQLSQARKVNYIQGHGRFVDAHTLRVANDSELTDVHFDHAIIATGSVPAVPRALQIDSPLVWDSTAALELEVVPERLLVVGGGYIGLELGSVYAALGSTVTIVEMTGGLLPGADRDLVAVVQKRITEHVEQLLLNTTVVHLEESGEVIVATLSGVETENERREFDRVLVAVGRHPNAEDMGLESLAVTVNERGFIETDVQRRTGEPSIFAIGDVAGEPMLAHKATHEARTAVEAIAGEPSAFAPAAIPAVVFTDPELAWTGLTETEARMQGIDIQVSIFPWSASGRASTIGRNDGLTKLILEPGTERVLGVGIAGSGAGELIGEATLAVEMGARADDLRLTIHSHPTLSETLMEAAELFFNTSPHYIGRRR
jgi:dihydrolipoamide dehydrogenase